MGDLEDKLKEGIKNAKKYRRFCIGYGLVDGVVSVLAGVSGYYEPDDNAFISKMLYVLSLATLGAGIFTAYDAVKANKVIKEAYKAMDGLKERSLDEDSKRVKDILEKLEKYG